MRPIGLGLAVALVVAVLAPAAVVSAPKKLPEVSAAARKQGMAEAPAFAQAAGLKCQVTDARYVAKAAADKKAGLAERTFYEVACRDGMGFVLQVPKGETPTSFNCVEADTPAKGQKESSLPCILPANADPKATLAPLMAKVGAACTPTAARGIGQSKTSTFMEVACQDGSGYVVVADTPFDPAKPVQAQNCLAFAEAGSNVQCELTDQKAWLSAVDRYAAAANNGCVVKERGWVGMSQDGSSFYEAACESGKGYIYKISNGKMVQAVDCALAQGMLGGCKLTDAREAETEQAALYTNLAKQAGSTCAVTKYAIFPSPAGQDVVELVCSSGSGGVGIFRTGGKSEVLDCAHALVAGYKCGLNGPAASNTALTADLRKFDVKTCTVSNSRLGGQTSKGTIMVEVACSDGLPGYMIEYTKSPVNAVGATGCRFIGNCALPSNKTAG